jgi:pimeloyl-ACP methyl ester carboxylesterase
MSGVLPRRLWSLVLVPILVVAGMAYARFSSADPTPTGFPSVGQAFADPGPFDVSVEDAPEHTYFFPDDLGGDGRRHPVILWGNATGAEPEEYVPLLRHLASHGFIVAAADSAFAGSGLEMLAGLDHLEARDGEDGDRFAGVVDLERVGATGHSQGADGAMQTASDPRVGTVFPIQPWEGDPSASRVPSIFFSGEEDDVAPSDAVRLMYEGVAGAPAALAELAGADHLVPLDDGGRFRAVVTAWARWRLMEDEAAEGFFAGEDCRLCTSEEWSVYEVNDAFVDRFGS